MNDSYVEHLQRHGGMATTGEHLGVMVAPPQFVGRCPPGWVFVDQTTASPEQIRAALDHAASGRKTWPGKDSHET